ncbi:unnamed protein product, partial [Polarella glacialis]
EPVDKSQAQAAVPVVHEVPLVDKSQASTPEFYSIASPQKAPAPGRQQWPARAVGLILAAGSPSALSAASAASKDWASAVRIFGGAQSVTAAEASAAWLRW